MLTSSSVFLAYLAGLITMSGVGGLAVAEIQRRQQDPRSIHWFAGSLAVAAVGVVSILGLIS